MERRYGQQWIISRLTNIPAYIKWLKKSMESNEWQQRLPDPFSSPRLGSEKKAIIWSGVLNWNEWWEHLLQQYPMLCIYCKKVKKNRFERASPTWAKTYLPSLPLAAHSINTRITWTSDLNARFATKKVARTWAIVFANWVLNWKRWPHLLVQV